MYKYTFLNILLILVILIGLLFIIKASAPPLPNEQKNGFFRNLALKNIHLIQDKTLEIKLDNVCGITDEYLYFSVPNPQWIIRIHKSLNKRDTIFFPIKLAKNILSMHSLKVDSPFIQFFANNAPAVITGKLKEKKLYEINETKIDRVFTKAVNLTPNKIALRTFDSTYSNQIFRIIDNYSGKLIHESKRFENKFNNGLNSDGFLFYDNKINKIIFLQMNQNNFFVIDTNLQSIKPYKTIDTINVGNVIIKQVKMDGIDRIMPSNSRVFVNKKACVDNGLMFVLSGLRADNENLHTFNRNSIVDIYRIANGNYIGSFYIPNIKGEKTKSLLIKDSSLVAVYDNYISTYLISFMK